MKDGEILRRAIAKAVKNGWLDKSNVVIKPKEHYIKIRKEDGMLYDNEVFNDYTYVKIDSVTSVIFSHSFAKAFWGEEQIVNPEHFDHMLAKWQYHLQAMVVQENPLQYLEKFLDEKVIK